MLIIAISVQTGEPNGKWYRSVGVTAGKSVWSPETFNRTPIKYIASLPPLVRPCGRSARDGKGRKRKCQKVGHICRTCGTCGQALGMPFALFWCAGWSCCGCGGVVRAEIYVYVQVLAGRQQITSVQW